MGQNVDFAENMVHIIKTHYSLLFIEGAGHHAAHYNVVPSRRGLSRKIGYCRFNQAVGYRTYRPFGPVV